MIVCMHTLLILVPKNCMVKSPEYYDALDWVDELEKPIESREEQFLKIRRAPGLMIQTNEEKQHQFESE